VVIAIIGILASIVLVSLTSARAKSRDSKRLADIRNLSLALELYANDHNGLYPSTGGLWFANCPISQPWGVGGKGTTGAGGWIPNLAPTYVPVLPLDPTSNLEQCYFYASDGIDYMVMAYKTVETYTTANNPRKRPAWSAEPDFVMYTPGAIGW
jgi:type II secretory pathway pseudopilin PulG